MIELNDSDLAAFEAEVRQDDELWSMYEQAGLDVAGSLLDRRVDPDSDELLGLSPYWAEVKKQMYLMLCTDDPAYREVRNNFQKSKEVGGKYIITPLCIVIAGATGATTMALVPFVSLLLFVIAKLGVRTYCSVNQRTYGPLPSVTPEADPSTVLHASAAGGSAPEPSATRSEPHDDADSGAAAPAAGPARLAGDAGASDGHAQLGAAQGQAEQDPADETAADEVGRPGVDKP